MRDLNGSYPAFLKLAASNNNWDLKFVEESDNYEKYEIREELSVLGRLLYVLPAILTTLFTLGLSEDSGRFRNAVLSGVYVIKQLIVPKDDDDDEIEGSGAQASKTDKASREVFKQHQFLKDIESRSTILSLKLLNDILSSPYFVDNVSLDEAQKLLLAPNERIIVRHPNLPRSFIIVGLGILRAISENAKRLDQYTLEQEIDENGKGILCFPFPPFPEKDLLEVLKKGHPGVSLEISRPELITGPEHSVFLVSAAQIAERRQKQAKSLAK